MVAMIRFSLGLALRKVSYLTCRGGMQVSRQRDVAE